MTMPSVPLIEGLRKIAQAYDSLIVDLWGVVHGGVEPYPDVLDTLAKLQAGGKRVALLSNAPRRARRVAERLEEMGVPKAAYDFLLTSGEAARRALAARDDPEHAALGRAFLYIGPSWDTDLVEGLDYRGVDRVEDADFLLVLGLFDESDPMERYDPLFGAARERELPMLCVNPDLVVQRQGGGTVPCAGMLAKHYVETHGGRVIYHGKPDAAFFRRCAAGLGGGDDARVLVVGDALATDIRGAAAAGFDSLWVTRGIHAEELGIAPGAEPDQVRMQALCERYGQWPNAAIATFRW